MSTIARPSWYTFYSFFITISSGGCKELERDDFSTAFTPALELAIALTHIGETAGAAADIALRAGRIAEDKRMRSNILCHDGASPDERECSYRDAAHDHRDEHG